MALMGTASTHQNLDLTTEDHEIIGRTPRSLELEIFFGEDDRGITVGGVRAFEKTMAELGKSAAAHIYPKAGHAFALSGSPSYREAAARDAWQRTWEFLAANLRD